MIEKIVSGVKNSSLTIPLTLLVLCVLAYGLLIPTLGFYWDDWPYAWINHMFGPGGFPAFVSSDRPHSAWIFMALTSVFGEGFLGYHISSLLFYWLCAFLFWRLLRWLWPQHERESFWGALLFTIYPGFLGHPNAIIYNHHFIAMALVLFSLIGMIRAIESFHHTRSIWGVLRWHIPSVLALIVSQFSIEYYLGWEAVRPLVIWFVLKRKGLTPSQRVRTGLVHLTPYWLATLGFVVWRVFIFKFPTYAPISTEESIIFTYTWWTGILKEVFDVVFAVWGHAIPQLSSQEYSRTFWLAYLGLFFLTSLIIFIVLALRTDKELDEVPALTISDSELGFSTLLISLVGIAFAGLPFWLVDLPIEITGPTFSRFTLAFIPWVAMLIVALLHFMSLIRVRMMPVIATVVVSVLVGGSTSWHLWNANLYRNDWIEVQRFFQQLVRRAPSLAPGTTLLVNDMRFLELYSDNSLTAILNWTFAPEKVSHEMDYMVYYLSVRLGRGLPALEPGLSIAQDYRSLNFSGSTDKLLLVYTKPPGCLRILDDSRLDFIPGALPEDMMAALPLSNLSLIQADVEQRAVPPLNLFDVEPINSWCLYFEEADLAGQQGDWERVAELGDLAFSGNDRENETTEVFIFLEGYLRSGRLESALEISDYISERSQGLFDDKVCNLWQGVADDLLGGYPESFDFSGVTQRFCAPE